MTLLPSSTQSTVIRASAGSGKTYQLSLRFIALMALGARPAEIIALTFTRKAAGEFTERIIRMLADGAASPEKASTLAAQINKTWLGETQAAGHHEQPGLIAQDGRLLLLPELSQEHFISLLQAFVHDLGRLNLSTLDSFFGNLSKSLSMEIGVNAFSLVDEAKVEQYQTKVLLSLFDLHNSEAEGRDEFIDTFRLATLGSDDDRLDRRMLQFVKSYHHKFLHLPQEKSWGNMANLYEGADWEPPSLMPADFPSKVDSLLPLVQAHAEASAQWKKDRLTFLENVKNYSLTGEPFNIPTAYKPGSEFWKNANKNIYVELYRKKELDLGPVLGRGIIELLTAFVKAEIMFAAQRTKGIYRLISLYDSLYDKQIRRQGLFSFDDITRLLLSSGQTSDMTQELENLRYRMDGWYSHWMLDEFQDTSLDQWKILRPFLEEVAMDPEHERSLFIVGDPKQSIYQWRGGEPRIFDSLAEEEPWESTLKPWSMDVSYRSSQVILDFANLVCDFRKTAPYASKNSLDRWEYNPHAAGGNNKELTGHAQVWTISKGKEEYTESSPQLDALSCLLARMNPLERGLSCAIMVNSNKECEDVSQWLRSPAGGSFLVEKDADSPIGEDSPLGAALADFFRWLNHPADQFAWRHVKLSPLGRMLGDSTNEPAPIHKEWLKIRDRKGVSGIVEKWRDLLLAPEAPSLSAFNRDRLYAWLASARDFDKDGGSLEEWISLMENMKRKEHSSSLSIRVMTIHKAKGLEFDIVILPFLKNDAFDSKSHMDTINKPGEYGDTSAFTLTPSHKSYEFDPVLGNYVSSWSAEQEFEGFCKLYVALTRAKRATYIFVPAAPKRETEKSSAAEIVRTACSSAKRESGDLLDGYADECLLELGMPGWYKEHPLAEENSRESAPAAPPLLPSPSGRGATFLPSEEKGKSDPQALSPEDHSDSSKILGTQIHQIFEKIDWLEDNTLPLFLEQDSSPAAEIVRKCLSSPEIRSLFILPGGERPLLWREHHIAGNIAGKYYSGIIDRAVLSGKELHLIDFKSDTLHSEIEFISRYKPQLDIYGKLLASALGGEVIRIKSWILSTYLQKIIPLE